MSLARVAFWVRLDMTGELRLLLVHVVHLESWFDLHYSCPVIKKVNKIWVPVKFC